MVDENLFFYEEWELEACVDGALLATQMRQVNLIPFTYQQLHIFKRKLDEFYPQGYPQSLIERLSYFFLYVTPEDIHKWNVTSLDTVKSLLKVSQGRGVDAQVAALIARYVGEEASWIRPPWTPWPPSALPTYASSALSSWTPYSSACFG